MAALPSDLRGWAPVHAQRLRRPVDRAGPRRLDFPPRDDGLRRCIMPRIFIALPVDAAVRRTIAGAIPKEDGAVRWVKEHQYHITLKFLGETSEHELQQTGAAVEQVGRAWTEPLHLAVRGVGAFPNTARARVVWVGITGDVGPLLRLQRSVEQALA